MNKKSEQIIKTLKYNIRLPSFMEENRGSKKDFTRNRKLPFPQLINFLLSSPKHTLQKELTCFIQKSSDFSNVSKSAFCQQRVKLKPKAFIELNDVLVDEFYNDNTINIWEDFRLLAIDGSTLELPSSPETLEKFGYNNRINFTPMAKISTCYDLLNEIVISSEIAPNKTDEYSMAVNHIDKLKSEDLLIMDRGYGARWLFNHLTIKKINYVVRIQHNFGKDIDSFWESRENSLIIEINQLPNKSRQRIKQLGIEFIPFKMRLVKFELGGGKIEMLATSLLDEEKYPVEMFKNLYGLRWGIETNYNHLKNHIEIGNFTGLLPTIIKQDFYASMLISNIQTLIIRDAQEKLKEKKQDNKYKYKINRNLSLGFLKEKVVDILISDNPKFMEELKKLFQLEPVPIRSGRKFERKNQKYRKKHYMNQRR
ncbi:MAG: IS4 family transposase, partial [Nanoarchaeota archaeon]|nr:IS4 family transposase [Nanoarchaeota archaeon]